MSAEVEGEGGEAIGCSFLQDSKENAKPLGSHSPPPPPPPLFPCLLLIWNADGMAGTATAFM